MTRKRRHIMNRMWEFLIEAPIGKVRRPITATIIKRRKIIINIIRLNTNKFKSFRLLKQLQQRKFGLMGDHECEFTSPDSTPVFCRSKKKRTVFLCLACGGSDAVEENDYAFGLGEELLEKNYAVADLEMKKEEESAEVDELEDEDEDEESVDRRAEKFIERFYQEMRLQRQKSEVQFMEMLNRSC